MNLGNQIFSVFKIPSTLFTITSNIVLYALYRYRIAYSLAHKLRHTQVPSDSYSFLDHQLPELYCLANIFRNYYQFRWLCPYEWYDCFVPNLLWRIILARYRLYVIKAVLSNLVQYNLEFKLNCSYIGVLFSLDSCR